MAQKIGLEAVFDMAGFNRAMGRYGRLVDDAVAQTGRATQTMGQKFLGVGGTVMKGLGVAGLAAGAAATAVGGSLAALGVDSVKTANSVETAFAGVVKTTEGLTSDFGVLNEAGQALKKEFKDLAETVPVSVEELMRIGELGGQLGIAKEELLDFTSVIADIGTATDLTTDEAAVGFAQFMNVMGTAQEDVDRLGSAIVDLGNNFATNEPQILSFAQRIAGAGAIAGLTEADVLGIGTAMASVGVEAEAGGTAVQKVLIAMNTAAVGAQQAAGTVIDNSEAMAKSQDELGDMAERLAIAEMRLAETSANASEATRMAREKAVRDLQQDIAKEQASLEALAAAHGTTAEEAAGQLDTFAQVAGMTADDFTQLWERDAGAAFERFVLGLGAQGDEAINTLAELELEDQRLVRAFLSVSNAGDLLTRSMDGATDAWAENTALAAEAGQRYATTESQMAILRNQWRNAKDSIGTALNPALKAMITLVTDLAEKYGPVLVDLFEDKIGPALETAAEAIRQLVGGDVGGALATMFGEEVGARILEIADAVGDFVDRIAVFVNEHAEGFKAALIAIGAILAGAAIAAAIAGIATALSGVGGVILAIGAAVGVLTAAWTEDWGGIRTFLTELWQNTLQPTFQAIGEWLRTNIPAAMAALKAFWESNVQPVLQAMGTFFGETIPAAIGVLISWFQEHLLPVIQGVVNFIQEFVVPLFQALAEVYIALIGKALEALVGVWENLVRPMFEGLFAKSEEVGGQLNDFLAPAIQWVLDKFQAVGTYLSEHILPLFEKLRSWVKGEFGKALQWFADNVLLSWKLGFQGIKIAIEGVVGWLGTLKDKIGGLSLPGWLTPGSPTPFELGLRGISDAMRQMAATEVPRLQAALQLDTARAMAVARQPMSQAGRTTTVNRNLNLTVNTAAPVEPILADFAALEALG
jgi:TP901 family phage tail tape measure protein